jgi:hypothetical protein
MLLVQNLPQPAGLMVSGEASASESRLQLGTSHRVKRRWMNVALNGRPEPVFQL